MAQALENKPVSDLNFLTDCMYFINGRCKLDDNCRFRHCREAVQQINNCAKWPKKCRNVTCPYRHPTITFRTEKKKPVIPEVFVDYSCQPLLPTVRQEGFISFFWDIENVPIPKGHKPFDIVQRIRQKLVVESGLQEADFSCYCNSNTISQDNQQSLQHATVRIIHVPDRKPNAVDRQIMLDLDRFERIHRPPATIVLISGDIDFVGKLSDLRHQARFHVIIIHNKPAKEELKATVNAHYPWELFTQQQQQQQQQQPINVAKGLDSAGSKQIPQTIQQQQQPINVARGLDSAGSKQILQTTQQQQQPINVAKGLDSTGSKQIPQTTQQYRSRDPSTNNCVRGRDPSQNRRDPSRNRRRSSRNRRDPSQTRQCPPNCQQIAPDGRDVEKHQCPICISEFESIQALRQHQNAKNHLFRCLVCDEDFITKEDRTQHQKDKKHYILNYKCNQCNRLFAKLESLNQHQQATGHISSVRPPSSVPLNNHNSKQTNQDPIDIILNGIEAIKQHFSKQSLKNN